MQDREDGLQEYSGTAIWNKENNNIIGVKYNSKDEWVICENAHPAIITKEELQNALERKSKTSNNKSNFKADSDYLLSGLNIENNFLFTCSECGGHIIGCSTGKNHIKKYGCATNRHKGTCSCQNNWKIEKEWTENIIVDIIEKNYLTNKKVDKVKVIDNLYKELSNINNIYDNEIKSIAKEIKTTDTQIQNLLNSIKTGIAPELVVDEINKLKVERENLNIKRNNILNNMNNKPKISKKDIEEYFYNFQKLFSFSNTNEKKELIKTFISNITLNKKEHHIEINLFQHGFAVLEQVAGIEPA